MSSWEAYPADYRAAEVRAIVTAAHAGESASVLGLSGAGKTNLLGFLVHRVSAPLHPFLPVDCNRLPAPEPQAFYSQVAFALGAPASPEPVTFERVASLVEKRLSALPGALTLCVDRFDVLADQVSIASNLRALRDAHKYQLTFVVATRRPLPARSEFAELVYAHTLWLGCLGAADARWNVERYAQRLGLQCDEATLRQIVLVSSGYPAFLRAVCEAWANGAELEVNRLAQHPAVQRRVEEFLADQPTETELQKVGLANAPLLKACQSPDPQRVRLTAKEARLLSYFQAHAAAVCEKDDLIRSIWPEDKVFEQGVRDDSLAQLVRRLREKVEADPANPRHILTVPGRGYSYHL